jgi:dUTP pyrophosphatase
MSKNNKIKFAVLNPLSWINVLNPKPDENQIQPNGIDLRANQIYSFQNKRNNFTPYFAQKSKQGLNTKKFEPKYDKKLDGYYWELKSNSVYIIEYLEAVKIPNNAMGLFFPRSSLWRLFGALIHTSVWDSGYQGVGRGLLETKFQFKLEKGTPVGQLVLFTANSDKIYKGTYQGEGL